MQHNLRSLCGAYNHATAPWRLLTDREHERTRQHARAIRARLSRLYRPGIDYREMPSGVLLPLTHLDSREG